MKKTYLFLALMGAFLMGVVVGDSDRSHKAKARPGHGPPTDCHAVEVYRPASATGAEIAETLLIFDGDPPRPDRAVWTIRFSPDGRGVVTYYAQGQR